MFRISFEHNVVFYNEYQAHTSQYLIYLSGVNTWYLPILYNIIRIFPTSSNSMVHLIAITSPPPIKIICDSQILCTNIIPHILLPELPVEDNNTCMLSCFNKNKIIISSLGRTVSGPCLIFPNTAFGIYGRRLFHRP